MLLGGIFDYEAKREHLLEVERELEDPQIWNNRPRAQELGRERVRLENIVKTLDDIDQGLNDARELLALAVEEQDAATVTEVANDLGHIESKLAALEFRRMFGGEMDEKNAFLDIQAGSGGTEAQDWAEMLLRMYLRASGMASTPN